MSVYKLITQKMLQLLKENIVPWQRPWRGPARAPQNLLTKRHYRGINALLLGSLPYRSPYWTTYRQAQQLGGHVRRGEHSSPVVFWRWMEQENEEGKIETFPVLRYYRVFNLQQCEIPGDKVPLPPEIRAAPFCPIDRCEDVVRKMPLPPAIEHDGGNRAYYHIRRDTVHLPEPEQFENPEAYYATLFHELTHATGHQKRLARKELMRGGLLSDLGDYSKEELVAEMGAAFLCGHCGIATPKIQQRAASYVHGWLQALAKDHRLVVQAAANAQKAADYLLRERSGAVGAAISAAAA